VQIPVNLSGSAAQMAQSVTSPQEGSMTFARGSGEQPAPRIFRITPPNSPHDAVVVPSPATTTTTTTTTTTYTTTIPISNWLGAGVDMNGAAAAPPVALGPDTPQPSRATFSSSTQLPAPTDKAAPTITTTTASPPMTAAPAMTAAAPSLSAPALQSGGALAAPNSTIAPTSPTSFARGLSFRAAMQAAQNAIASAAAAITKPLHSSPPADTTAPSQPQLTTTAPGSTVKGMGMGMGMGSPSSSGTCGTCAPSAVAMPITSTLQQPETQSSQPPVPKL